MLCQLMWMNESVAWDLKLSETLMHIQYTYIWYCQIWIHSDTLNVINCIQPYFSIQSTQTVYVSNVRTSHFPMSARGNCSKKFGTRIPIRLDYSFISSIDTVPLILIKKMKFNIYFKLNTTLVFVCLHIAVGSGINSTRILTQ